MFIVEYASSASFDPHRISTRVAKLEHFIHQLYRYLVPSLREKLGISGLQPIKRERNDGQLLIRRFIAYTFPSNLERLAHLTRILRGYFPE